MSLLLDGSCRRTLVGTGCALVAQGAVLAVMVPFRSDLSTATVALAFVVPVVLGVVAGGFTSGVVTSVVGVVLYDIFFLPPYGTLTVASASSWLALAMDLIVTLLVTKMVSTLHSARDEARRATLDASRLFELSQSLIGELTSAEWPAHIVEAVQSVLGPEWTALLVPATPDGTALSVAAVAGRQPTAPELHALAAPGVQTRSLGWADPSASHVAVALVATGQPVGLLVLHEVGLGRRDRAVLGTFANQAALAIERSLWREQAQRTRLLEEIDRWRSAMMGAVSHDLRTPLASVKAAVSALRQDGTALSALDRSDLLELIEVQSDRLARLVTNLLDMTRIETGALVLRTDLVALEPLVRESSAALEGLVPVGRLRVELPADLPLLDVDHVLIVQVLTNLLENAARAAPDDSPIAVEARRHHDQVEIWVTDQGPGIDAEDRTRVFEMFNHSGGGGRAGMGLAIAKAFVEAHGGTIWIDAGYTGGTRVAFTVPAAAPVSLPA